MQENQDIYLQDIIGYTKDELTLRNDHAFKWLFAKEEHKIFLIELLSLITDIEKEKIEDLEVQNPHISKNHHRYKLGILDIKVKLKTGEKIAIEMQNLWHKDFDKRILRYWARLYDKDLKEGEDYTKLSKTIVISLLNQRFPYTDKVHSIYKLLEVQEHTTLGDILELHFLDMSKIDIKNLDELQSWLLFIQTKDEEVRKMLAEENKTIGKANSVLRKYWASEEERQEYEDALTAELEKNSLINTGRLEGRLEGITQRSRDIALNLIKEGIPYSIIAKTTGLDESSLRGLV